MVPTRRSLLTAAVAPWAAAGAPVNPAEFRAKLAGPICSVPTVYREDRSLDLEGFRRIVETGVKSGCSAFALTSGNNQYDRLAFDEIETLTRTLVEAVAGRGLTIAATGPWWTGQVLRYAKLAREVGADALQVQLPAQGDQASLYEHFRQAARGFGRAIVLHGQVPLPLLRKLVEIGEISGYKEEYPALYSREVFEEFGQRINIFAGGQKGNFLTFWPFGMRAYYSTFSTFAPRVAREFWSAIQARDLDRAARVVTRYDVPFFRGTPFAAWTHAYWRATLEVHGIARRYLRQPEVTFDDQQVAAVRDFQKKLGLLEG